MKLNVNKITKNYVNTLKFEEINILKKKVKYELKKYDEIFINMFNI